MLVSDFQAKPIFGQVHTLSGTVVWLKAPGCTGVICQHLMHPCNLSKTGQPKSATSSVNSPIQEGTFVIQLCTAPASKFLCLQQLRHM